MTGSEVQERRELILLARARRAGLRSTGHAVSDELEALADSPLPSRAGAERARSEVPPPVPRPW